MGYAVIVLGMTVSTHETLEGAQAAADALNADVEEELGYEIVGDGAASVIVLDEQERGA